MKIQGLRNYKIQFLLSIIIKIQELKNNKI